jgi:hypothetical protein
MFKSIVLHCLNKTNETINTLTSFIVQISIGILLLFLLLLFLLLLFLLLFLLFLPFVLFITGLFLQPLVTVLALCLKCFFKCRKHADGLLDYWITVLNHVQNGTDVKAQHARPIVSKAYQSSSNQIITITTMCHLTLL